MNRAGDAVSRVLRSSSDEVRISGGEKESHVGSADAAPPLMDHDSPNQKARSRKRVARVLIVDDHPMVRRGFAELISHERDLMVCGEADGFADAVEAARGSNPDLAIVDIALKDCSGLELVKQLRSQHPELKMLVCSMHDETVYAERALHAGAMGYVSKEQGAGDVVEAIRQVLADRVYLSADMAERILHRARGGEAALHVSPVSNLTDRELEIFELFGKGLSAGDISARLHISTKTVDAHRQKIKRKLDFKSSSELVQHAVQWVLEETGAASPAPRPQPE